MVAGGDAIKPIRWSATCSKTGSGKSYQVIARAVLSANASEASLKFKYFHCSSFESFAGSRRALTRRKQCGHGDERMVSSRNRLCTHRCTRSSGECSGLFSFAQASGCGVAVTSVEAGQLLGTRRHFSSNIHGSNRGKAVQACATCRHLRFEEPYIVDTMTEMAIALRHQNTTAK